jgi:CelD/BcsL family acetyltransferase involved in cellulose biosynthesis
MVGAGTTVTDAVLADTLGRRGGSRVTSDLGAALFDEAFDGIPEAGRSQLALSVHEDFAALEGEWRRFQDEAACTVFQTFEWLSAWQRHLGARAGVRPAIVTGRGADGQLSFLFPLAVERRGLVRRLTWLGRDLCDYNAPLLAPDFSQRVASGQFPALWREVRAALQSRTRLRHDTVELDKMPETIGGQPNPFLQLAVDLNPSGAYSTALAGDWEAFYGAKRSASTRRRDRTKLNRLTQHGEVRFVSAGSPGEGAATLDTLISQKSRAFARMGVPNIFAPPGRRDFYLDLATAPEMRHLVHVSELLVGDARACTNLGLIFRGCYYHVLASHDGGELSAFSPGAAHLRELLRHAIGLGLGRFDFTIGDEPYKREWSDTELALYDHASAATLRGWPASGLAALRRRVKRAIKQNPALWLRVTRARAGAAALLAFLPGRRS